MVLQSQSSLERIQGAFDELCKNIMEEELCDNGRTLRRRGLSTMKLTLSPMETRHETAIRVIVGQLGAIGIRLKALEGEAADRVVAPMDLPATTMRGADASIDASLTDEAKAEMRELREQGKIHPAEKPLTQE